MKHAFVYLVALSLSACALTGKRTSPMPRTLGNYQKNLTQVNQWTVKGRVSIVAVAKDDAWSGSLIWKQFDHYDYDILFVAPITNQTLRLLGSKDGVVLESSDRKKSVGALSPEALLKETMNWDLPVSGMRYWVLGLASPGPVANIETDQLGRVKSFVQTGWKIRFLRYKQVNRYQVPDKLVLQNSQFKVKIILKSWQLGAL